MFQLKYFVLLALAVSVGFGTKVEDDLNLNSDEKSKIAEIEGKCIKESNAKLEEVHKFDKGEFADNKPLREFYKCLLTSFGVMDEQGKIVKSKIKLLVPENLLSKAAHCFNVEKGEPSDVAYGVYKCYIESVY